MLYFKPAGVKWWNKPLVDFNGKILPAELVVLETELLPGESGVWLNTRSITTGVSELACDGETFRSKRIEIPEFVGAAIQAVYRESGLSRGCPDLVIWNAKSKKIRFVEVKCPKWDKPFDDQIAFMKFAQAQGIMTKITEWVFL